MSLQIVQPKQKVDLVVFKHSKAALDRLIAANQEHISEVDPTQNLRLTHTNGHAGKPGV